MRQLESGLRRRKKKGDNTITIDEIMAEFCAAGKKTGEVQRTRDEEIREIAMAYSQAELNRVADRFRPVLAGGFKTSELPFLIAFLEQTAEMLRKDVPEAGPFADALKKQFGIKNRAK